jgi:membrane-bound serine protease (ClpP class)
MLALGSIMLFDTGPIPDSISVSKEVIFGVVGFTAIFFLFIITLGIKAQHLRASTGPSSIIGEIAIALSDLKPLGQVSLHGEIWSAENLSDDIISKGENVEIVNIRDLDLMVRKCNHASQRNL